MKNIGSIFLLDKGEGDRPIVDGVLTSLRTSSRAKRGHESRAKDPVATEWLQ